MNNYILFVSSTWALIFIFLAPSAYAADTPLSGLAPANLYAHFITDMQEKIKSAQITFNNSYGVYKKLDDDKAQSYEGSFVEGVFQQHSANTSDHEILATHEAGKRSNVTAYQMKLLEKNGLLYLNFPDAINNNLQGKWIIVPKERYEQLGEALGLTPLFKIADNSDEEMNRRINQITLGLARKYGLFYNFGKFEDDGFTVSNATRYNLAFNTRAFAPYFKELANTLTVEEAAKTVLAVPGFKESLSDAAFINYVTDYSYISLWFDNTSQLPRRMLQIIAMPSANRKGQVIIFVNDIAWDKVNVPVTIHTPTQPLTFEQAVDLFGLDIDLSSNPEIARLKNELKQARSKNDKAILNYLLAEEYSDDGQYSKAAEFYRKAASFYRKKSSDYYHALAQAEWALGNGRRVIENFELALKKDPENDYILNQYGWFLTGLSPVSAPHQDLKKALEINTLLVNNLVDDSNLINLYVTYTLLGRKNDADALISRFDNFQTGDNYNVIARMYHRLGDRRNVAHYQELAKKMGYEQSPRDEVFFAINF